MKKFVFTFALTALSAVTLSAQNEMTKPSCKDHCAHATKACGYNRDLFINLYAGCNAALGAPEAMDTKALKSWEIMLTVGPEIKLGKQSPFSLTIQAGVDWRNYRMTGSHYFAKDMETQQMVLRDVEADKDLHFSRIKTFSIVLPVLLHADLGKGFNVGVGPMFSYVPFATFLSDYSIKSGSLDYTERTSHVHQSKLAIDLMGQVTYKNLGLYLKYSPTNVIRKSFGPEFQSLSFGLVWGI